jgi:hypothetical protein
LDTEGFVVWLSDIIDVNPASQELTYVRQQCEKAAHKAEQKEIKRVSAWDEKEQVLRISGFDGSVFVLSGDRKSPKELNGEHVIFDDGGGENEWLPYEPVMSDEKLLYRYTTTDPNWAQDRENCGLALRAWILATFFTDRFPSKALLAITGDPGSGKTVAMKSFINSLYGNKVDIEMLPSTERDFAAAINESHTVIIDNLDSFTKWVQDCLAVAVSGGGRSQRKLYTNAEKFRVLYDAWIAITSMSPATLKRPDLIDRSILLYLNRFEGEGFEGEAQIAQRIERDRNKWWGSVFRELDQIVAKIKEQSSTEKEKSILRIADWALFAKLVADVEGIPEVYERMITMLVENQRQFMLDNELTLLDAIESWIQNPVRFQYVEGQPQPVPNEGRTVTGSILYRELGEVLERDFKNRRPADWPRTAKSFTQRFKSIAHQLGEEERFRVDIQEDAAGTATYTFCLRKDDQNSDGESS